MQGRGMGAEQCSAVQCHAVQQPEACGIVEGSAAKCNSGHACLHACMACCFSCETCALQETMCWPGLPLHACACPVVPLPGCAGVRQVNRMRAVYLAAVLRQDVGYFDTTATSGEAS